jgi:hypothetical protein
LSETTNAAHCRRWTADVNTFSKKLYQSTEIFQLSTTDAHAHAFSVVIRI